MKIEIELIEVERLKDEIKRLNSEIDSLNAKLKANEEKEWEKKAILLSKRLLNKYFEAIFSKLGFDTTNSSWSDTDSVISYENYIGDKWHENKDKLTVNFNLRIYDQVKTAYLKLGVIPDSIDRKELKTMLSEIIE